MNPRARSAAAIGGADADGPRIECSPVLDELGLALETIADEHDASDTRLVLRDLAAAQKQLPLAVDFLDKKLLYRLTHGFGHKQPLGRALGMKNREDVLRVLDVTAGLGTDAFLMAALGCKVRAVERNPIIAALLRDGFRRLKTALERGEGLEAEITQKLTAIGANLHFDEGEAMATLSALSESERPDVVYLDPMFPEEGRSEAALPKKAMQIFRRLIGPDSDAEGVIELALTRARSRVVVKRPLLAPPLGALNPSHSFTGKTARLDMYLCN